MFHDGLAHWAWCAFSGLQVHQQAGSGIHFHNRAALCLQRFADVLCHHVDTGNVQPHDTGSQLGRIGYLWVNLVSAIHRQVTVALDGDHLAGRRHRIATQPLALQFQLQLGIGLQHDHVQRELFFGAAPRVAVELAVDQLHHGRAAIPRDGDHLATCSRNHLATHHQQAVFLAGDKTLDHHVAAFGLGYGEGRHDFLAGGQLQRHTTAMVGVRRLHGHRHADVLCGLPGLLRAGHHLPFGHGHTAGLEQALGQILVAGDTLGNRTGLVALGRPDAALRSAITQLHQVAVVQADVRNAAVGGGVHDTRRAGAEVAVFHLLLHGGYSGGHVKSLVADGRHDQAVRLGQGCAGHLFVAGAEHHAVDPRARGAAGLAKPGGHPRQVEQLDHDVLQHMAGPGAFFQPLQEATTLAHPAVVLDQRWQHGGQPGVETGDLVGGVVLQRAQVKPDFEDGPVSPDIGAPQVVDAKKLDVVQVFHVPKGLGGQRRGIRHR